MDIVSEKAEKGVVERRFDVKACAHDGERGVDDEVVPGIMWLPDGSPEPRPTILIGHGGTQHKRVPNVLGLARRFVRHLGYNAVAIDAPGHGDRVTDAASADATRARLQQRIAEGAGGASRGMQLSPEEAKAWVERTRRGVIEWKAVVDDIAESEHSNGKIGYWGVSMGTAIGLPFVAAEPRIDAAVIGLAGLSNRPGADDFERAARSLTIPILFVFQWDDELMTRESGIGLFDAIGSSQKTMHVNPGGHVATPLFERDAYDAFFTRHLSA